MIPYDIDPSLHNEPREPKLDDGFSPPPSGAEELPARPSTTATPPPVENLLWEKSGF